MATADRPPGKARRVASIISAVVLTPLNVPPAFLTVVQLMPHTGPHEWDAADKFAALSWLGIASALLVLGLTLLPVLLRWLSAWWCVPPLAMAALLLVRLLVFPPYEYLPQY